MALSKLFTNCNLLDSFLNFFVLINAIVFLLQRVFLFCFNQCLSSFSLKFVFHLLETYGLDLHNVFMNSKCHLLVARRVITKNLLSGDNFFK